MVWFQCEDCGEDLKKPKLPNHFRICSAYKLSCIDCGEVFGQQTVQSHTQCITEAEKYGPKGQGKVSNSANANSNKNAKQQPDFDINVGLSERPPWFCSLCNTSATSRQTLLLHAEGKKHRAKARAHHAAKQPKVAGEAQQVTADNNSKSEMVNNNNVEEPKDLPKADTPKVDSETANGSVLSSKKRKNHGSENDGTMKKIASDTSGEAMNGEVVQAERIKVEEKEWSSKKVKLNEQKEEKLSECVFNNTNEETKKKIKWKKLIKLALKSNPDGVLKFRKLRKIVLQTLRESGVQEDETVLTNTLEHKLESSSRFTVDGKYIRLKIKD